MENEQKRYEDHIAGRNAVTEALKSGRPLDSVLVAKGDRQGSISAIVAKCRQMNIPVKEVDSRKLDAMAPNHQGVIAVAACKEYAELEDLFAVAAERGEPPFFIVCDELEDPHNQSYPTLCDPMDHSLSGSSVHGILQARMSEWVTHALLQGIFPTRGLNPCVFCLLH